MNDLEKFEYKYMLIVYYNKIFKERIIFDEIKDLIEKQESLTIIDSKFCFEFKEIIVAVNKKTLFL